MSTDVRQRVLATVALVVWLVSSGAAAAATKLASVFTDNMVIQRERPAPVWGWAGPGEAVTVTFAGQKKTATAGADGKWVVTLDPLKASAEPAELTVTGAGGDALTVRNVLVGEVWLCGGQSNMGLSLRDCFNADQEIADAANYPQLRLMAAPASGSLLPADNLTGGAWQVCSPEVAGGFAGTAYFFGRALCRELKVPVGLIEFDRGATGIECWVPLAAYQSSEQPALQEIGRTVDSWNPASPAGRAAHEAALKAVREWVPTAKQALADGKPVPAQPALPAPDKHQSNACEAFNGTVHPLIPFAIRGATWYQGESNPGEGEIYSQKMRAMILGWRGAWGIGDFPVYFVQLANEGNPATEPDAEEHFRYVPVREAQRRVLDVKNTGMVVAIDLGEDASGHPRNKRDVGERLAAWALANDYGRRDLPFSGPLYREHRVEGDRVILSFDHVGSGLMVADKEGLEPVKEAKDAPMTQFAVAGEDGTWHWAEARIEGETVVVRSDKVPAPVAVRYAYTMNPKGPKLYNRDGLPASPFSTSGW